MDELAAETVQNIFHWKISGMNNQSIADRLNAKKVPSPAARKLQSGAKLSLHFRKSDEPPWSAKAVDRMEQIQRLRTEKNQIFQPVKKDADNLQAVMDTVGKAGDVMHLSQNVVETFIDRIEVFNDERVKIRFPFEDVLAGYAE